MIDLSIPTLDHRRADVGAEEELPPLDCRFRHDGNQRRETEAPAVAERGATILYTINSNRSRLQIILDHATLHKLTADQIHELVSLLPDYTPTAQIIPLHPAVRRERAAGAKS